jgi:subtilisin
MMSDIHASPENGSADSTLSDQTGEFTGRYLVVFSDEVQADAGAMSEALQSMTGVSEVASTRDFAEGALDPDQTESAEAIMFAELGVAVVAADPTDAAARSALEADPRILAVEPERIMHAIEAPTLSLEYVRGYRDGISHLYEELATGPEPDGDGMAATAFGDNAAATWGIQATRAATSTRNGAGVRVAVLDTGLDLRHADYVGRPILSRSFISGQAVQDLHGHGTHCVGTACGPRVPPGGSRRYGVATHAPILVGKVLSNQGSGSDSGILAGIDWAISNGARIISMSLGANVQQVSQAYETIGRRANSPSIMAVGAVDSNLRIGNFSARSNPVVGGKVDIAGPGVAVYSSWPMPNRYHTISGTSMATPHVSGVAALIHQQTGARGAQLWTRLIQTARPLSIPSVDVGAGLVQAPQ